MDALVHSARSQPALPALLDSTRHGFYFLRHGQTARNAARIFQDRSEPLDATGQQQATAAAQRLGQEPIRSIVGSDVLRASQTADTVARQLGLPWTVHTGLRERHFGALIGTSSVNLDWACAPTGGETLVDFVQRTCAVRLWGGKAAWFVFWGYNLFIVLAATGYLLGQTQSKEYAEPE